MPRFRFVLIIVLIAAHAAAFAAPRRRAVRAPSDATAQADWLARSAHVLATDDRVDDLSDLAPLRSLVGSAGIVALADGTHGTREYFTVKLRIIEYLVRELGFDAIAIEAPFPIFERINSYVQGGPGNPRALLRELNHRLYYFFWDTEEILAVIEWARDYNLHRGERPPIEIAGADIHDDVSAISAVIEYLRGVDPAAAADAELAYSCVLAQRRDMRCRIDATAVRSGLMERAAELAALAGRRAFDDAVQHATVVVQSFDPLYEPRDRSIASNVRWIREHRGASHKVVFWGHQEHVGQMPSSWVLGRSAGTFLHEQLGDDYFAIGTLSGSGSFARWDAPRTSNGWYSRVIEPLPPPESGSYEWHFACRNAPILLVPLKGQLPDWLASPARYRMAGTLKSGTLEERLADKFDAVIYIDRVTPTRPLQ